MGNNMKKIINHNNGVLEVILENKQLKLHLVNVGASIFKLFFNNADIIVGPKELDLFIKKDHYYGKTVGRFSGRLPLNFSVKVLKDITLKPYKGKASTIHGGAKGLSTRTFNYVETKDNEAVFTVLVKEEEDNIPGDVFLTVKYQLTDNELILSYKGTTTKTTLLNITNHSYFNLDQSKTVHEHKLSIDADKFILFDDDYNIQGLKSVLNTIYDLKGLTKLKKPLNALSNSAFKGFDTIYKLNKNAQANLYCPSNGSNLEISTSYPALVVYTHNDESPDGLDYYRLWPHVGIALECEYEPGGILHDFLSDGILKENETYNHFVKYKFTIK